MKVNYNAQSLKESQSPQLSYSPLQKLSTDTQNSRYSDIFIRSCLFRNEDKILSPMIFTKRPNTVKMEEKISPETMALEYLYSIVNKLYYKSSYDIEEFMKELGQVNSADESEEDQKEKLKNTSNVIRKSKRILKKKGEAKNQSQNEINGSKREKTTVVEEKNILDYLISPIKTDFCYG